MPSCPFSWSRIITSTWFADISNADDKLMADLWLLNSCTVKNPAEDHFRNEIKEARHLGKSIVVAGCVPQGQPKADYIEVCTYW